MQTVLLFGIGFLAGILVRTLLIRRKTAGTLWICHDGSENSPWIFLELSRGIETIANSRLVTLEVQWKEQPPHN